MTSKNQNGQDVLKQIESAKSLYKNLGEAFGDGSGSGIGNTDKSDLPEILNRIGVAEESIEKDKNEVLKFKEYIEDKLKLNFNLVIGVLIVGIFAIITLVGDFIYTKLEYTQVARLEERINSLEKQLDNMKTVNNTSQIKK